MMRPNKQIHQGAHKSGTAGNTGKSRYFGSGVPQPRQDLGAETTEEERNQQSEIAVPHSPPNKYDGRASVGHLVGDDVEIAVELEHKEWVDPLDQDTRDLTNVTIDLRAAMIPDPPDTYFQRHSSRVPGRD